MKRGALILCGGESSRMGVSKAMLPFGPETMLERVVRLIRPTVSHLVVVGAPGQTLPALRPDVLVARDRREGRGPLEGLAEGLRVIGDRVDAVFASGCDVPLLVPAFIELLFHRLGNHQIVVPREDKYYHPLAAVYRPSVLACIERLLATDRLRPFYLFEEADTLEVPVEQLRSVDPKLDTLRNLNHPKEYLAALDTAGFKAPPEILRR